MLDRYATVYCLEKAILFIPKFPKFDQLNKLIMLHNLVLADIPFLWTVICPLTEWDQFPFQFIFKFRETLIDVCDG